MAIELARAQALPKPWGVLDLRPWSRADNDSGRLIGEIWYERPGNAASDPSLLLKLLFTSQPLSIQVHPDDAYAQSMGLARGKTEAWYILSAAPGAKVALGLKQRLALRQLRAAVDDGSIADLVAWRTVLPGDVVFVPAGTIHAIGAGLVIAEIQQRSDATFRMFDFGRKRELHVANAIAVADRRAAVAGLKPKRLTDERTLLVCDPHFAFERIESGAGRAAAASRRNARPGCSLSEAAPAPGRSASPWATPFSRSRIASTYRQGPTAWCASWRTRAPAAPFHTSCSASHSRVQRIQQRRGDAGDQPSLTPTEAPPANGHVGALQ